MLQPNKNQPLIMGIVNFTPDSFYKKSCFHINQCSTTFLKFADIIDVGCESSRPGSIPLSEEEEMSRLSQFLDSYNIKNGYYSIDTYKPTVARYALENGFSMINDIYAGGVDHEMLHLAVEFDCPIVLMHLKGTPTTMQNKPFYNDVIADITRFFENKLKIADEVGIKSKNIILDPGIGFGKRIEDNDNIIVNLNKFKQFNHPILVGISRKSFLSINNDTSDARLTSSIAATVLAIQNGANILRVHDVKDTYKLIKTINRINNVQVRC